MKLSTQTNRMTDLMIDDTAAIKQSKIHRHKPIYVWYNIYYMCHGESKAWVLKYGLSDKSGIDINSGMSEIENHKSRAVLLMDLLLINPSFPSSSKYFSESWDLYTNSYKPRLRISVYLILLWWYKQFLFIMIYMYILMLLIERREKCTTWVPVI